MGANTKGKQHGKVVFSFIGPPGSGKGTLAELCRKNLGFQVLSTGNLCRKHVALDTEFGKLLDKRLRAGQLIPDHLITEMVWDWLVNKLKTPPVIILDGYPRTRPQAESFMQLQAESPTKFGWQVIFFDISEDMVVNRLSNRVICSNQDCQSVYSLVALPPKREGVCDRCGSLLYRREDDQPEVIRQRLLVYNRHKDELITFFQEKADLGFFSVEYLTMEDKTHEQVFKIFKKRFTNYD